MTRFIVCAVCTIKGSALEGIESKLWYGNKRSSAERVLELKKKEYGSLYKDWRIVESN